MHMVDVLAASIDRNRSRPIASLAAMVHVSALSPPETVSARQAQTFRLALGLPSPEEQFDKAMLPLVPLDEGYSHRRRERSQLPLPKDDGFHVYLFQFTYLS
jgi:hypothetical protein